MTVETLLKMGFVLFSALLQESDLFLKVIIWI